MISRRRPKRRREWKARTRFTCSMPRLATAKHRAQLGGQRCCAVGRCASLLLPSQLRSAVRHHDPRRRAPGVALLFDVNDRFRSPVAGRLWWEPVASARARRRGAPPSVQLPLRARHNPAGVGLRRSGGCLPSMRPGRLSSDYRSRSVDAYATGAGADVSRRPLVLPSGSCRRRRMQSQPTAPP